MDPDTAVPPGLSTGDWIVVGLYFGVIVAVALGVSRRQRSTRDYFLGGRSLPWWAASLSIVATETSAVTFVGVPFLAYSEDWWFLQLVVGFVIGRFVLATLFVRAFYQKEYETVYGYLGDRFGPGVQKLASFCFLGGRVIASGVRLFAGCVALQVAIGPSEDRLVVAILALSAIGVLLTTAGGIRAVVWTDVLLGATFMIAAVGCAGFLLGALPDGLAALSSNPAWTEKTRIVHLGLDLTRTDSLLAGLLGGFALTLASHGTDQDIAQRMLTCKDSRSGSLSVLGSAALLLPLMLLFLFIGTLLHFFYQSSPGYPVPEDNRLFPTYIVRELPLGFSGFVMAGLLAASLSSLTSALNALSSTAINDFYRPLRFGRQTPPPGVDLDRHLLRVSRGATLAWGGVLTLAALAFVGSAEGVVPLALRALSYFYGALLGAFLLALLTQRGTPITVACGMLLGVTAVLALQLRAFLDAPANAPPVLQPLLTELPGWVGRLTFVLVPPLAWPYWIIVGATICFGVGAIGRRNPQGQHSDRDQTPVVLTTKS